MHRPAGLDRRFAVLLAMIVAAGAVLRLGYVVSVTRHDHYLYDATYYDLQARSIANGDGFFHDPFLLFADPTNHQPAAEHPPVTVLALLPAAFVPDPEASTLAMRLTMVAAGTLALALIGLLGRNLAGPAVGLVAAGLAAVDPNLWMNDGLILSEPLAVVETVLVLLGVYRLLAGRPGWRLPLVLGVTTAVATLTRAELALYLPLLVVAALVVSRRAGRRWLAPAALAGAAFAVVVAPWIGYNLSRFQETTTISTSLGLTARSANCPATYYGPHLGSSEVLPPCSVGRDGREQSVWDAELRRDALDYMRGHAGRMPVVAAARVGRAWNVFRVGQTIDSAVNEGRPAWAGWSGAVATWVLAPLAVSGGIRLRRGGVAIWPLLVPVAVVTLVLVAFLGGVARYRAPAEPTLLLLAAAAIVHLVGGSTLGGAAAQRLGQRVPPGGDGVGEGEVEHPVHHEPIAAGPPQLGQRHAGGGGR
jgi:4-amino-4-deoxy-L-arabinose transferase-like glycosyltransferase